MLTEAIDKVSGATKMGCLKRVCPSDVETVRLRLAARKQIHRIAQAPVANPVARSPSRPAGRFCAQAPPRKPDANRDGRRGCEINCEFALTCSHSFEYQFGRIRSLPKECGEWCITADVAERFLSLQRSR